MKIISISSGTFSFWRKFKQKKKMESREVALKCVFDFKKNKIRRIPT